MIRWIRVLALGLLAGWLFPALAGVTCRALGLACRALGPAPCLSLAAGTLSAQVVPIPDEWTAYGRDAGGTRYSPLAEVHRGNVADLEVAWIYRTGDLMLERGRFQSTPLVVDGRLYVSSPLGRVSAVEPATGRELWTFDPQVSLATHYGDFANRGVAYWRADGGHRDASAPGTQEPCAARAFIATIDARLFALDAATGSPCPDFGDGGAVDLRRGLRNPPTHPGEYQVTSPPAVIGDRIVVGSAIADNQRVDAPSGVVRAFHARTGAPLWAFDPVPQDPSDPAYDTWRGPQAHRTGAANAWAPLSADPALGLVYVPTTSPSPDYYGGERRGRNDYASSLVALEAETGRVRWHFQAVHHDLWDYDLPAQPVLFPFRRDGGDARAAESLRSAGSARSGESARDGEEVPAVALATKMGLLFVLDRRDGIPLHPVEERPVPASTVPGEEAWPTQPFPVRPAPFVPHRLDPEEVFGPTEEARRWCRDRIAALRNEGIFTPPSLEGTVMWPGNVGGMHWGGVAVDPERGIGVAPTNRLPFVVTLIPRAEIEAARRASPGAEVSAQRGTPYGMSRQLLFSPAGTPCAPPPWGALTAVDLVSGEQLWEVPLGRMGPDAPPELGSPNMGGALLTAGGLVFMAGTPDRRLRAFDVESGRELWAGELPMDGVATPMTYRAGGRQYVVVAAGGHDRMRALTGAPLGDHLVAFALPRAGEVRRAPAREPGPASTRDEPLFTGGWKGELRVDARRLAATLAFAHAADLGGAGRAEDGAANAPEAGAEGRTAARLEIETIPGHAALSLHTSDEGLTLAGPFRSADGGCQGGVELAGEAANHGHLLVGEVRLDGDCFARPAARGHEGHGQATHGTFSFRRQP